MVSDKANKRIEDFHIAPVRPTVISASYFIATVFSTLLVCLVCLALGLFYIAVCGWYLSALDVLLIVGNLILCTMFGALFAVIVETFLKTQGAGGRGGDAGFFHVRAFFAARICPSRSLPRNP